ncbi:MAG: hypothetical protein ABII00_10300 [Elusimicrobiota bacterium]
MGSAFEGMRALEITVFLGGTLGDPKLKLSSNLGQAAAGGLKRSVGRKIAEQRKAIEEQVDKLVGERTASLTRLSKGKRGELSGRLGGADAKLGGLQDRIARELKIPAPKIKGLDRLFR